MSFGPVVVVLPFGVSDLASILSLACLNAYRGVWAPFYSSVAYPRLQVCNLCISSISSVAYPRLQSVCCLSSPRSTISLDSTGYGPRALALLQFSPAHPSALIASLLSFTTLHTPDSYLIFFPGSYYPYPPLPSHFHRVLRPLQR